ncbi:MAG: hypothetical protein JO246_08105 [Frankiaceae bacterium]|nr:hypothetical protein [Frankiaceae bacterium]MBV9871682.1 hypothetical protein [Frankiaceae bacterium]
MGLFSKKPVTARVGERDVACLMCQAGEFWTREIKLNSTGMELFDLGWANASATGLICTSCGYIHEFVGDSLTLHQAG